MHTSSIFQELWPNLVEKKLGLSGFFKKQSELNALSIEDLCLKLVSSTGDYSNLILAENILARYQILDSEQKKHFFHFLLTQLDIQQDEILIAAQDFHQDNNYQNFKKLLDCVEPLRQTLFRRLNQVTKGTIQLVRMREDLFSFIPQNDDLKKIDADFQHLFASWFNRGFLVMQPISWNTPANILEKVINYESVHEIKSWHELRIRVEPTDRKCYAFFHPAMLDDPLIFVEVALTDHIPHSIAEILNENRQILPSHDATYAVFYSISNCHQGLKGIQFGNILIKQVASHLQQSCHRLNNFVTLSPVPRFHSWLKKEHSDFYIDHIESAYLKKELHLLDEQIIDRVMSYAAQYFLKAKHKDKPFDPVARFHLNNGASLKRLNWSANNNDKGLQESLGLMVNYLYDLAQVEVNHEAYASEYKIQADQSVWHLLN